MLCYPETFVWFRSITTHPIANKYIVKFHLDNLKRFQSLPTRVATCVVYLLLGVLPLEAELHKRQLGLLYNILISDNETMQQLAERQIAINLDNKLSYFSRVQDILDQYRLPPLRELMRNLTTKDKWKLQIKAAIHKYWSSELRNEALERSTLCYMDIVSTKVLRTKYGRLWNQRSLMYGKASLKVV